MLKSNHESIRKRDIFKSIIYILLIFISILLIVSSSWAVTYFNNVNLDEIVFHLLVPMEGTGTDIIYKYIYNCIPITIVCTIFLFILINKTITKDLIFNIRIGNWHFKLYDKASRLRRIVLFLLIVVSFVYSLHTIDFDLFIQNQFNKSSFIEENYVDPRDVNITFPSEKRNLIYIYLESMEYTFEDSTIDMNVIPELTKLQKNNVSFNSNHGAYSSGNTTWTIAAMVGETAGIPLNISISSNAMYLANQFMPGLYNLGDILYANDYNNYLLVGSDATFGGRRNYFVQHGNYQIFDLVKAIDEGYMTSDDFVFWGFDDSTLFSHAKRELSSIDKTEPFNYTLLTVNTHHPEGYLEDGCENVSNSEYGNALSCSSKQVYSFINWIKKQSWYDNTTIVISGDHPSMNTSFFENLDSNYIRTTYQLIINPAIPYVEGNREYSTIDMFPTTLASLGVTIEGDKLGLGTNLFSNKKTLVETYGQDYVDSELKKSSTFYTRKFLMGSE